jgi:ATP-dependent Lon protease
VLPIGGLKEKLLAALRGGIRTVIIPEENAKDLADIPANVTEGLNILPVRWIDEVLDIALERPVALPPQPAVANQRSTRKSTAKAAKTVTRRRVPEKSRRPH